MRVVFRTEGGHQQGMGDVWGSLALAEAFARTGVEVRFVISGGEEAIAAVMGKGFPIDIAASLEAESAALIAFSPDVIVVNKLKSPAHYIKRLKAYAPLVATIDDDGEAAGCADLSVNVLYHAPGAVTQPGYIALRDEFRRIREMSRVVNREVVETLITQGGSDTYGFTPRILKALEGLTISPHFTVVIGPAFRHDAELEEAVQASTLDLTIVREARNMADLMWNADLAVTAGGVTMYELACVGTPSVVVCGEPFEASSASRLEEAGALVNLGFGGSLDYARLPTVLDELAGDLERRQAMSRCGMELVDGRGCERIVALIQQRLAKAETLRS